MRKASEYLFDDRRIDVELSDVVTDVLLTCITEQIELGLIGPQNRPVRADEVKPLRGVIETRFQLTGRPPRPPSSRMVTTRASAYPPRVRWP